MNSILIRTNLSIDIMKYEMEILSPTSYSSSMNWLMEESKTTAKWTQAENKMFENALAVHDKDTPDRWHKVAAMIPGKTVSDVMKQYRELEADVNNIEAGLVPVPGYGSSAFTLDWVNNSNGFEGFKQSYGLGCKRSSSGTRPAEQERKKGVPWTEDEHKLFLMGLKKYGKGDWRNISRNFVITRTPTQVASHAQKYFIRQLSGGKDKRRASIHDITTVNLNDNSTGTPSPDNKTPTTPDQTTGVYHHQQSHCATSLARAQHFQWIQPNNGATMTFDSTQGNMFTSDHSPYNGMHSYGVKLQGQNLSPDGNVQDSFYGPHQNLDFQMQTATQNYL